MGRPAWHCSHCKYDNLVSFTCKLLSKTLKMLKNLFSILSEFIVAFSVLVTSYCTSSLKLERELTKEYFKLSDAGLIKEPHKNNTLSTVNETLFWTLPDMKNTTEMSETKMNDIIQGMQDVKPEITESVITEESFKEIPNINLPTISPGESTGNKINYGDSPQKLNDFFQINEKIILPRNNCHAEIAIHENRDMKLAIKFGELQNNSYGRCCLTLSGPKNSFLGVLISNIHLYRNNTQGEVLKVIVRNHYTAFILKEYYGSNDYEPLLLTETHKVYLILYYKVEYIAPNQDCTSFNIEIFAYQKHESNINHCQGHKGSNNHVEAAQVNHLREVYSTEEMHYFTPYTYNRTDDY